MIRAQVIVRPRASIFDPQGDAVQRAIQHLGVSEVKQAHVGKFIELEVDARDLAKVRGQLETICKDLLSNPVIEDYVLTLNGGDVGNRKAASKPIAKKAIKAKAAKKPVKKTAKPPKKAKKPAKPAKKKKK
jgi:phosphoribosylformylglycinamidine synthase